MTPVNWPALKALGYKYDRSSMWGHEGTMWFSYIGTESLGRFKTKSEAMRACRSHADRQP